MGADCKSAGYAYASSNLARPIIHTRLRSSVVEHILGKDEVMSSILIAGLLIILEYEALHSETFLGSI